MMSLDLYTSLGKQRSNLTDTTPTHLDLRKKGKKLSVQGVYGNGPVAKFMVNLYLELEVAGQPDHSVGVTYPFIVADNLTEPLLLGLDFQNDHAMVRLGKNTHGFVVDKKAKNRHLSWSVQLEKCLQKCSMGDGGGHELLPAMPMKVFSTFLKTGSKAFLNTAVDSSPKVQSHTVRIKYKQPKRS